MPHLHVVTILDHRYKIHQVHKLPELAIAFVEIFLLLHVVAGYFVV